MSNLHEKACDFCAAIKETKEWRAYQNAAKIYGEDENARKLMNDFAMARQELAILQEGGFSGQEEQRKIFESLREQVRKNKAIGDLADARKKMEALVGDLAVAISNDIDFPFNLPPKKNCGCHG